jgi:hypothetical protein
VVIWVSLVMMTVGVSRPRPVMTSYPDGARVAGEPDGGGFVHAGLVVAARPVQGDLLEVFAGQGVDVFHQGG